MTTPLRIHLNSPDNGLTWILVAQLEGDASHGIRSHNMPLPDTRIATVRAAIDTALAALNWTGDCTAPVYRTPPGRHVATIEIRGMRAVAVRHGD